MRKSVLFFDSDNMVTLLIREHVERKYSRKKYFFSPSNNKNDSKVGGAFIVCNFSQVLALKPLKHHNISIQLSTNDKHKQSVSEVYISEF